MAMSCTISKTLMSKVGGDGITMLSRTDLTGTDTINVRTVRDYTEPDSEGKARC